MATPKKTKNGHWRALVYIGKDENGKRIYKSVTSTTKAQCAYLASMLKAGKDLPEHKETLREVVNKYIENQSAVNAASSTRGFEAVSKYAFQSIMDMPVEKIDNAVMQKAINEEAQRITYCGKTISPKTVHNEYGLICTALRKYAKKTFDVKLPALETKIKEFPDPAEIIKAIKGTDVELPCLLAMWLSLSMSELRGINCSAIRGGVLHIEQVKVYVGNHDVIKQTGKVGTRIRNHELPDFIMELINNTDTYRKYAETGENGPLIPFTEKQIYSRWKKICKANNWDMTFHDLRAVNASIMLMLNIPDKYQMQRGGWATDHIMKTVYQQTFSKERQLVDQRINDYFKAIIDG